MNQGSRCYDTRTTVGKKRSLFRMPLLFAGVWALFTIGTPSDADACVAEVYERTETVKVSAHETAMAMSHAGSSMWFRLEFAGNPKDFGVLIPASKGSTLGLAAPEFFDTLRSMTTPQIRSVVARGGGGGCGCGSALDATNGGAEGDAGVMVVAAANVGPYATVTLRATDPDALGKWLDANGFVIDDAAKAAAATYVAEGMDFIAVKFRPGATTTKMPPLRLDTPTHDMRVLLRMAQSGAGETTDMVLYVLSTQRVRPMNFPEATVSPEKISLDASGKSNYDEVARKLMAEAAGRTWITEFAGLVDGTTYEQSCRAIRTTGQKPVVNPIDDGDASTDASSQDAALDASDASSLADAADAGSVDASLDGSADASGGEDDAGEIVNPPVPDLPLACSSEDLFRRFPGTGSVYVTRLRGALSRAALAEDMMLEAHPKTDDVPRTLIVGGNTTASIAGRSAQTSGTFLLIGATFAGLAVTRRRHKRRP